MKKKLIITFSIIAVLAVAGYFGYRFAVNYVFDEYVVKSALTVYEQIEKEKTPEDAQEEKKGIQIEAILDGLKGINKDKYREPELVSKSLAEGSESDEKAAGKKSDKAKGEDKKSSKKTDPTKTEGNQPAKSDKNSAKKPGTSSGSDSSKAGAGSAKGEKPATSSGKRLSDSEILSRIMADSDLAYKLASMVSYADKQTVISMVMSNFTADELAEMAARGMSKSEMISVARSSITGAQWSQCMAIAQKYIDQIRPYVE